MPMIQDRLAQIEEKIEQICQKIGRDPKEIILIGVSKNASVEKVNEALRCGLKHIGENRVQEALKKFPLIDQSHHKVIKHMIGHLQTNKVKSALPLFELIQSVDSFKVAREIDKQAFQLNRIVDVLIQINTSQEKQKFGLPSQKTKITLEQMIPLKHIHIQGLMTMAPFTEDETQIHLCFSQLREMRDELNKIFAGLKQIDLRYLSMGMSHDYEIALKEGANMLRIGRAIFEEEKEP